VQAPAGYVYYMKYPILHVVLPLAAVQKQVAVSMPFSHEDVHFVYGFSWRSLHDDESSLDVTSHVLVSNCEKEGSFSSVNYNA